MDKPANLKTKIFLDGGDPVETKEIINLLGFLDGQTTNPTLISKNPQALERLSKGEKFTKEEILVFYKQIVQEIAQLIPQGSVSIEVSADETTSTAAMFLQAKEMNTWIPNAHIKFPTTKAGLTAAEQAVAEGIRVNMTLCFSQEQAAVVYVATKSSKVPTLNGFKNVFVSPFIGRLDDRGESGMDLIKNIIKMYSNSDGHVEVLTASVRNLEHLLAAFALGSDIVTVPFKVLKEWAENGLPVPGEDFIYDPRNLKPLDYREIDLNQDWHNFNITHELTDIGIEKFSQDWDTLICK